MNKIQLTTIYTLIILFANGCGKNTEIADETLKINVFTESTLTNDKIKSFFSSVDYNGNNYVPNNNSNKIGINIIQLIKKSPQTYSSLSLKMNWEGILRKNMGVYDLTDLNNDLKNFNTCKKGISSINFNENQCVKLDIDNFKLSDIRSEIKQKIKKNIFTVNFLLTKNKPTPPKGGVISDLGPELGSNTENKIIEAKGNQIRTSKESKNTKVSKAFFGEIKLQIRIDSEGKNIVWTNFGEITYTLEFIDYISGNVCCSRTNYPYNQISANQLLTEFNCIKSTNRYILRISTNVGINRTPEKVDCCSIGFQSGHFAEDCDCDNTCN